MFISLISSAVRDEEFQSSTWQAQNEYRKRWNSETIWNQTKCNETLQVTKEPHITLTCEEDLSLKQIINLLIPIGSSPHFPIYSASQLANKQSGEYYLDLGSGFPIVKFFIDLMQPSNVWIRLNYKVNLQIYPTSEKFRWTIKMTEQLIKLIKDFGFSDKLQTIHTDQSWYLENVIIIAKKKISYQNFDLSVSIPEYAANVFNGLTPTGTEWSLIYNSGYVWFTGTFKTYGTWTSMYNGCNNGNGVVGYYDVNTERYLKTGGQDYHTGEYIHSGCNGYGSQDNSITSRVDWDNTRVFWARIQF